MALIGEIVLTLFAVFQISHSCRRTGFPKSDVPTHYSVCIVRRKNGVHCIPDKEAFLGESEGGKQKYLGGEQEALGRGAFNTHFGKRTNGLPSDSSGDADGALRHHWTVTPGSACNTGSPTWALDSSMGL